MAKRPKKANGKAKKVLANLRKKGEKKSTRKKHLQVGPAKWDPHHRPKPFNTHVGEDL